MADNPFNAPGVSDAAAAGEAAAAAALVPALTFRQIQTYANNFYRQEDKMIPDWAKTDAGPPKTRRQPTLDDLLDHLREDFEDTLFLPQGPNQVGDVAVPVPAADVLARAAVMQMLNKQNNETGRTYREDAVLAVRKFYTVAFVHPGQPILKTKKLNGKNGSQVMNNLVGGKRDLLMVILFQAAFGTQMNLPDSVDVTLSSECVSLGAEHVYAAFLQPLALFMCSLMASGADSHSMLLPTKTARCIYPNKPHGFLNHMSIIKCKNRLHARGKDAGVYSKDYIETIRNTIVTEPAKHCCGNILAIARLCHLLIGDYTTHPQHRYLHDQEKRTLTQPIDQYVLNVNHL